jgi:hypothetical protein
MPGRRQITEGTPKLLGRPKGQLLAAADGFDDAGYAGLVLPINPNYVDA